MSTPRSCYFDPTDGLMVTRFIDDAVDHGAAERFTDLGAVAGRVRACHRLHPTAAPFATDFKLFPMIDEYKTLLARRARRLPDGYDDVQRQAERAVPWSEAAPVPLAPCHCDPLCENFLDTGERMYLIDYEYAGNNDPMWDLGDLSVEGRFAADQDEALLRAYFDGDPPPDQSGRMVAYKARRDLLWTLWGVIQVVNENPVDDFWAERDEPFRAVQDADVDTGLRRPHRSHRPLTPPVEALRLHPGAVVKHSTEPAWSVSPSPGAVKHSTDPVWSVSPSPGCWNTPQSRCGVFRVHPGASKHSTAHRAWLMR